jgi:hypothetical protein
MSLAIAEPEYERALAHSINMWFGELELLRNENNSSVVGIKYLCYKKAMRLY